MSDRVIEDGRILIWCRGLPGTMEWKDFADFEDGWDVPVKPEEHAKRLRLANYQSSSPVCGKGAPKRFVTYEQEMYAGFHNEKIDPDRDPIEEYHDDSGAMEKEWEARGRHYAHKPAEDAGTHFVKSGPVIRSKEEGREYRKLSREILGPKGFKDRSE